MTTLRVDYMQQMTTTDFSLSSFEDMIRHVEKGEVNKKDFRGKTMIMYACEADDYNQVQFLLENGANPYLQDSRGISAEIFCKIKFKKDVLELIRQYPKCLFD